MQGTKKEEQLSGDPVAPAALSPSAASPEEAAAITAAIERFMRATAPAPEPASNGPDPWLRAAILEGITREDGGGTSGDVSEPWINP
jgi:hypothetical protein